MGQLNFQLLAGQVPSIVLDQLPDTSKKFNIINVLRLCHFLAQCAHESGKFTIVRENLNYSSKGLLSVFPKYFDANSAKLYERKPEKIGSRVYANRMGNSDESSGEGFKFRGRGYIQLTGKNNYINFTKFIGEDCVLNPDLVSNKFPLASAAYFFDFNKLWSICDKGSSDEIVTLVTKKVNNGVNGLEERIKYFKAYYNLMK